MPDVYLVVKFKYAIFLFIVRSWILFFGVGGSLNLRIFIQEDHPIISNIHRDRAITLWSVLF
jgi:hypothetical protein